MNKRAEWDFPYDLPSSHFPVEDPGSLDVVIATSAGVEVAPLRQVLSGLGLDLEIETLIARAPLFWTRVRAKGHVPAADVAAALAGSGLDVRYVTSARLGTMRIPPPLDFSAAVPVRDVAWVVRRARPLPPTPERDGQWFLGKEGGGVNVVRSICGTGAGTRLAVIDDEAAHIEQLEIESIICIGVDDAPKTTGHAALATAWATGAVPFEGQR
ncbi:MAG: hypothetical protein ACREJ3_08695, partial [Polyangiaceae bacterium]